MGVDDLPPAWRSFPAPALGRSLAVGVVLWASGFLWTWMTTQLPGRLVYATYRGL